MSAREQDWIDVSSRSGSTEDRKHPWLCHWSPCLYINIPQVTRPLRPQKCRNVAPVKQCNALQILINRIKKSIIHNAKNTSTCNSWRCINCTLQKNENNLHLKISWFKRGFAFIVRCTEERRDSHADKAALPCGEYRREYRGGYRRGYRREWRRWRGDSIFHCLTSTFHYLHPLTWQPKLPRGGFSSSSALSQQASGMPTPPWQQHVGYDLLWKHSQVDITLWLAGSGWVKKGGRGFLMLPL